MPDKKLPIVEKVNGELVINIGSSDENADWLKKLDNGSYQIREIEIHDDLENKRKEDKL